jgi:serine/threonine protein kinase
MAGTADDFLKTVLRSGLLDRAQLQEALRSMPDQGREDPSSLAHHLIKQGKLSHFQAHKLLKGASVGLQLGPFHIQTPIGRGGMGTVYLALDTRNQKHVAIKVLPPKLALEKEHYLARFQREMQLATKINHPNLALTHEVGVHKGVYFIAMEYIPGLSLYRLVLKEGPLSVPRAARLFAEVTEALEHAHGMNLIHRDLKPSNIMITPNDHAKVLDLGLAVFEGEDSEPMEVIGGRGYVVGSLDYIAPEQTADSLAVDARADLYGLGCSLYFALTGQPPFPNALRKKDKVHAHRYLEPTPLPNLNPTIPEKFTRLVNRLMAKNPQRRFPSAQALRQELLPWCQEEAPRPMDRAEDTTYQEALRTLEMTPPASEILGDDLVLQMDESSPSHLDLEEKPDKREWWWILGALGGFWIILLFSLLLIRLFR